MRQRFGAAPAAGEFRAAHCLPCGQSGAWPEARGRRRCFLSARRGSKVVGCVLSDLYRSPVAGDVLGRNWRGGRTTSVKDLLFWHV